MGGRGASLTQPKKTTVKPEGMSQTAFEQYLRDGNDQAGINRIWADTQAMRKQMAARQGKEAREITSSTYERAQKRLKRDVDNWFGRR